MKEYFEAFADRGLEPTAPIDASIEIAAPAEAVWAAISESGNLKRLHPFCDSTVVERWPGPGGRDHIHYYSGVHYQRDVLDWRQGAGYDLAVGPPSGKIAIARWWIGPNTPSSTGLNTASSTGPSCRFGIEVVSFVRADLAPEAQSRYVETVIERAIPPYLEAVVAGVRHYSETGDPVVRNQFGAHDLYSPATA